MVILASNSPMLFVVMPEGGGGGGTPSYPYVSGRCMYIKWLQHQEYGESLSVKTYVYNQEVAFSVSAAPEAYSDELTDIDQLTVRISTHFGDVFPDEKNALGGNALDQVPYSVKIYVKKEVSVNGLYWMKDDPKFYGAYHLKSAIHRTLKDDLYFPILLASRGLGTAVGLAAGGLPGALVAMGASALMSAMVQPTPYVQDTVMGSGTTTAYWTYTSQNYPDLQNCYESATTNYIKIRLDDDARPSLYYRFWIWAECTFLNGRTTKGSTQIVDDYYLISTSTQKIGIIIKR